VAPSQLSNGSLSRDMSLNARHASLTKTQISTSEPLLLETIHAKWIQNNEFYHMETKHL